MARALAATAAALAALTALVLTGATTGIDDWGIDHVSPGVDPYDQRVGLVHLEGLWRPFAVHNPWWQKLLDLFIYPASVLVCVLVLICAFVALRRSGRLWAALIWPCAWVLVNGIEVVGKHELTRPDVYWSNASPRIHLAPFDQSYPSGHAARALVIAGVVAFVWPRLARAAFAWALLVGPVLVVGADHTVSDVIGGALLGLAVVCAAHAMIRRWTLVRTSSSSSSAASWAIRSRSSRTSRAGTSTSPTTS
jgi:membrane-associated phospholipid phosphatase